MKCGRIFLISLMLSTVVFAATDDVATSTISIQEVSESPWHFALDSEFYINQKEQDDKGGNSRVTSYHLASVKYAYDAATTLKIVPTFEINSVPLEKDKARSVNDEIQNGKTFSGARFTDPFIAIKKSAGTVFSSDVISTEVRYYLPVSELSQKLQSAGIVRLDTVVPWTVGKWTFYYYLNPRLFLESRNDSERSTSLSFREHALASYNFTDSWSAYVMVGHRWLLKDQNFLKNEQTIYLLEVGATKALSKNFSVTVYLDNLFVEAQEDIELFKASKNDFTLYTSVNF
ncbi:hypothetical protein [Bdellovibrio sp. HCB-162]|uniref:hypothetical protein n=1 Tax=Bdellovibrio sp. HCB-162 TaxID=3394234 RepID=UPI0039BD84E8